MWSLKEEVGGQQLAPTNSRFPWLSHQVAYIWMKKLHFTERATFNVEIKTNKQIQSCPSNNISLEKWQTNIMWYIWIKHSPHSSATKWKFLHFFQNEGKSVCICTWEEKSTILLKDGCSPFTHMVHMETTYARGKCHRVIPASHTLYMLVMPLNGHAFSVNVKGSYCMRPLPHCCQTQGHGWHSCQPAGGTGSGHILPPPRKEEQSEGSRQRKHQGLL